MANIVFNQGIADIMNGTINLEATDTAVTSTNTLRVVWLSSNCTAGASSVAAADTNCIYWSVFEVGHGNYTSAPSRRQILGVTDAGTASSKTISSVASAGNIMLDVPDQVYTTSSNGQAFRYVGIMRYASVDSLARPLMLLDIGSDQSTAGGAVTIAWHASGVLNLRSS